MVSSVPLTVFRGANFGLAGCEVVRGDSLAQVVTDRSDFRAFATSTAEQAIEYSADSFCAKARLSLIRCGEQLRRRYRACCKSASTIRLRLARNVVSDSCDDTAGGSAS